MLNLQGSSSAYVNPICDRCQTRFRSLSVYTSAIDVRSRYSTELSLYERQRSLPRFIGCMAIAILLTVTLSSFLRNTVCWGTLDAISRQGTATHPWLSADAVSTITQLLKRRIESLLLIAYFPSIHCCKNILIVVRGGKREIRANCDNRCRSHSTTRVATRREKLKLSELSHGGFHI